MRNNKDLFSFIQDKYYNELYKKINILEKLLKITFLQELKITFLFNGEIDDIIIIFGDIEGFSYRSYDNMVYELELYGKFFKFINFSYIKDKLKNIFCKNKKGIDQYIGVSLLTGDIIEYYGIIGGIKKSKNIVNINFNNNYYEILKKEYPIINKINDSVIGNLYIGKLSNDIKKIKNQIFFYDMSVNKFYFKLNSILDFIQDNTLREFLNCYKKINKKYFWNEFICWSGYSDKNDSSTLEFFLKSEKRKEILKDYSFFNINDFIEPYICQVSDENIIMWFLIKNSYKERLRKGYYYYY